MPTDYAIKNGRTVMDATTYTGTGSNVAISNASNGTLGFQPDLVWIKSRSNAYDNNLFDSIRGARVILVSNTNAAQDTQGAGVSLTAFNTNGFQLGTDNTSSGSTNNTGFTYVGWQWQAGQGVTSSNTAGSITSTVSANTTAGFSVVTWTAGTSGGATIGHGLGVTPAMIIVKQRNAAGSWWVWHKSLSNPAQSFVQLNSTDAAGANTSAWNNTAPTSTVFSQVNNYIISSSGTAVAYCWSEIAGYSAFGSYTGNGSTDGPFVYTGFRPKYILIKRTDAAYSWWINDSVRDTYNVAGKDLAPNLSDAESSDAPVQDFLSNGFKLRTGTYPGFNASGGTYIYAAFAENPFKYANAR